MAVECSVCMENFQRDGDKCPKLLPCTHTLCLQCLQQLSNGRPRVQCPECRIRHNVPNRNVMNFPTNRYMVENLKHFQMIAHLEEAGVAMENEMAQRLSQMEAARAEEEQRIMQEMGQRVDERDSIIGAWQEAYSAATVKIERLQTDCDDMRTEIIRRDYQDLEAGSGECFGRCREDVIECYTQCRAWNKLSSALSILLLLLLGILYILGIIVGIPIVVSGITVMYTFYNIDGILLHVCQAVRDLCVGDTQDCWTRCKCGIGRRLIRSKDDVKGFFTRCKNGIQGTFPCKGCGNILLAVYPLILYFTLSIIYILSTVCACVLITAGFVIFCLVFSSIVIVVSIVIVAAAAVGTSIVFVICSITVGFMLIVSSVYIVFAMLFAVVCSFISEEKRNKNGIFALKTYYKNCKYAIDYFLTTCKKYFTKFYDFPGCSNFLSALKPVIIWVVLSVTVVVGGATLIAAGATIVAVVVAVAALVVCVVALCFIVYLIVHCIAACCCKE